jgi:hypothetical protein
VASRTSAPNLARQMLGLLKIGPEKEVAKSFFENMQIFPGKSSAFYRIIDNSKGPRYLYCGDRQKKRAKIAGLTTSRHKDYAF